MYSIEELEKYDYFKELLKINKIEYLLDSLTGLLQRQYIIDFIAELIKDKKEFTMAILDLDFFKQINDNYGHDVGDIVIKTVAESLKTYLGDLGIAGRYGGDEFIFLYFGSSDYNNLHEFYNGLYHGSVVLRRIVKTSTVSPFITGTIGSASFPKDANNYTDLFKISDKTLYRGKQKGRNCFIIYVKEKHQNLDVSNIRPIDLFELSITLKNIFDSKESLKTKIMQSSEFLIKNLRVTKMLFIDSKTDRIFDVTGDKLLGFLNKETDKKLLKILDKDQIFITGVNNDITRVAPSLGDITAKNSLKSLLMIRIDIFDISYGAIMFAETREHRIWESQHKAILVSLARLIAETYYIEENKKG